MKCKNCNTEFNSNFCPNCGQKKIVNRLNFNDIWNTTISSIFNYENGFFKTISLLFLRPNIIINDYISGKRKSYFNPIKLLFVILTIKTYIEINYLKDDNVDVSERMQEMNSIVNSDFFKLLLIISLIPILSSLSYLFFRKYKFNFVEHIVINAYSFSLSSLLVTLSYILNLITFNKNTGVIGMGIEILVFLWVYSNIFKKNRILSIIKAILIFIIGYFIFIIPINLFTKL